MNPISDSSLIPYPYLSLWICFPVINTMNRLKGKCRNANSGLLNGEHPEHFGMKFFLRFYLRSETTNVNYDSKIDAVKFFFCSVTQKVSLYHWVGPTFVEKCLFDMKLCANIFRFGAESVDKITRCHHLSVNIHWTNTYIFAYQ